MQLYRHNKSGRGLIEVIFAIVIIFVISGIYVGEGLVHLKEARGVALENQLTNLKYSLELFRIVEGRYPEDLRELNKKCSIAAKDSLYSRKYLELQSIDEEGYPVDPYGHRFIYDFQTGTLKTRGY